MSTVPIALAERSYDIRIDSGLLGNTDELVDVIAGQQVFVVSNQIVAPLYLDKLLAMLGNKEVHQYILPDGEETKNLDNYSKILDQMLGVPCDRAVTVIALGGGVVGDLAGFVAASYQRGVNYIQIPTTLLSQVDSSVGGKTGVNHRRGKNMIGAFYQPKKVIADIDTLKTLDQRQFSAGMAEVIKYGLINDYDFFQWIEQNIDAVMAQSPPEIEFIVTRSCQNKADIVQQDERETGVRALLNLGHTFGHALETATHYKKWLHGEAVAIGTAMSAHLSMLNGWISSSDCDRITQLLSNAGLPCAPFEGVSPATMMQLMQLDKKVQDGRLRLVVLRALGRAEIVENDDKGNLDATLAHFAHD